MTDDADTRSEPTDAPYDDRRPRLRGRRVSLPDGSETYTVLLEDAAGGAETSAWLTVDADHVVDLGSTR